jgi:hypothetical protein
MAKLDPAFDATKIPDGKYRVKFNKNKMRYERKVGTSWMRLYSKFWKDIKDQNDLKLSL